MEITTSCVPYPDPNYEYFLGWGDDGIIHLRVGTANTKIKNSIYLDKTALRNIMQLAIDYGIVNLSELELNVNDLEGVDCV